MFIEYKSIKPFEIMLQKHLISGFLIKLEPILSEIRSSTVIVFAKDNMNL